MNNSHKEKWAKMSYIWGLVQRPNDYDHIKAKESPIYLLKNK